ncbi:MAG: hypothetical protein UT24_C0006G0009 [Candidatus Woesebacteria bacterium GW2011_GWB1_39_12]|uniref:Polymerase beta nucleotidyltransferase domain-containing protein n=2 Tax=Candidatus Woeseibacteriota TaxID=1752722 RepID=A0A0G0M0E0_9BACT|nr:MAG: hypothetical protein UT23_C0010G0009 [Candidatus Woesebacteria bacterium GW2011_GWA1_39_12]KKR01161.1 MAG: hypothetical protein UT24_C0006G0009 [Candidatus Woesebacteria bacterium GW2011_GWB1_39_12]
MTKTKIQQIKRKVVPVLRKHGVKRASIFGSYVRGEEDQKSDIDLLVDLKDNMSLLDFIGLKQEVEEVLGKKVDLVEYQTVKPLLRKEILSDNVQIL